MTYNDSTYVAAVTPLVFALIPAGNFATMTDGALCIVLIILTAAIGHSSACRSPCLETAREQATQR